MKVLDPQSALLTNAEVYQFLQANPARKPDKQIGSYAPVNLTGYTAIRKDFNNYTQEVTPYILNHANVDTWISDLVKKLKPFDLTKTEIMNLINMGVGVRGIEQPEQVNGDAEETEAPDPETTMARDIQFFKIAVEESEERFPGEEGDERTREVIEIMKETIKSKSDEPAKPTQANGVRDL